VGAAHPRVGRDDHPALAGRAGAFQTGSHQRLSDPSALGRGIDDQHAEGGLLVGCGDLTEVTAQDQGDAADDAVLAVADDEQFRAGGAAGDIGQLGRVALRRQPTVDLDPDGQLGDPVVVPGAGRFDGEGGLDHTESLCAAPP
jgi:hypothetical protein